MTTSRISGIFSLLFITLLCVALVEGGYQLLERFVLNSPPAIGQIPSDGPAARPQAASPVKARTGHEVILRRNLFGAVAGEKPDGPPVAEKPEVLAASSLQIVLMGTVTGSEGTERAIILDKSKKKQELYNTGDTVQGALIKEIRRGKVILAQQGREEILDISEAAKVRPIAPPPVSPAPVVPGGAPAPAAAPQQPADPAANFLGEGSDPSATQIRLSRTRPNVRRPPPGKTPLRSNATQQQGNSQ